MQLFLPGVQLLLLVVGVSLLVMQLIYPAVQLFLLNVQLFLLIVQLILLQLSYSYRAVQLFDAAVQLKNKKPKPGAPRLRMIYLRLSSF